MSKYEVHFSAKVATVLLLFGLSFPSTASAAAKARTPNSYAELPSEIPANSQSRHPGPTLWGHDNATDVIVEGGYIRVIQDVRGKYGSEDDYVVNRPLRGPLNRTPVDHATDTYDAIDWQVKNVQMNPMLDGWKGDDRLHNVAFGQLMMSWIYEQLATRSNTVTWWTGHYDEFDAFMQASWRAAAPRPTGHPAGS